MNIYDAIKVLGIKSQKVTQAEVKEAYRQSSKKYHPDVNPSGEEMMKLLNGAYETLNEADYPINLNVDNTSNYGEELNQALNAIVGLKDLIIEVCGSWVWVSGQTKEHKDTLKTEGFRYSGNKKMWYFRPESSQAFWNRKAHSIDEIRNKYGSHQVRIYQKNPLGLQA